MSICASSSLNNSVKLYRELMPQQALHMHSIYKKALLINQRKATTHTHDRPGGALLRNCDMSARPLVPVPAIHTPLLFFFFCCEIKTHTLMQHKIRVLPASPLLSLQCSSTSWLSVACNGLQQYPYKLSTKKLKIFY
jgi:hypothetical protein